MSQAKRTIILEPEEGTGEAPTEALFAHLRDLVGTLMIVGGELTVRADRVRLGEIPGQPEPCRKCDATGTRDYGKGPEDCRSCDGDGTRPGRPDVLSETVGFIVGWRAVPRLEDKDPLTSRIMDAVLGAPSAGREQEPGEPEPGPVASPAEIREALGEPGADDDDAGAEPVEED